MSTLGGERHGAAGESPRARIVAPVSRLLGATDLTRTIAFYQDVLGFEVGEPDGASGAVEVISGEARLRFSAHDHQAGDWEDPRPAGSVAVFFETDDVAAMHAGVRERGGAPGALQNYRDVLGFTVNYAQHDLGVLNGTK